MQAACATQRLTVVFFFGYVKATDGAAGGIIGSAPLYSGFIANCIVGGEIYSPYPHFAGGIIGIVGHGSSFDESRMLRNNRFAGIYY